MSTYDIHAGLSVPRAAGLRASTQMCGGGRTAVDAVPLLGVLDAAMMPGGVLVELELNLFGRHTLPGQLETTLDLDASLKRCASETGSSLAEPWGIMMRCRMSHPLGRVGMTVADMNMAVGHNTREEIRASSMDNSFIVSKR